MVAGSSPAIEESLVEHEPKNLTVLPHLQFSILFMIEYTSVCYLTNKGSPMFYMSLLTYAQSIVIPPLTFSCIAPAEPFLVLMSNNTSQWFCL